MTGKGRSDQKWDDFKHDNKKNKARRLSVVSVLSNQQVWKQSENNQISCSGVYLFWRRLQFIYLKTLMTGM